jgi:hypothetical protein
MGAPFATIDDVDALRPLDADERAVAEVLLLYGAPLIRKKQPDIDARIAAGTLDPLLAQLVAVQMVIRVLRNLDGVRQETVGPSSITYDMSQAVGQLVVTDDDLATLAPAPTGNGVGVGTVRVGAGLGGGPGGIVGDRQATQLPRRPWGYDFPR